MQVFQTAGDPPNKGRSNFPNRGCKTNIKVALMNKVPANKIIRECRLEDCSDVTFMLDK
jgi:hypothetical protein